MARNPLQMWDTDTSNPLATAPSFPPEMAQDDGGVVGRFLQRNVADPFNEWLAKKHQEAVAAGLWTGGEVWQGGRPTRAGVMDAARQTAEGVAMGTTSSGAGPRPPGLSLEQVFSREGVGMKYLDNHTYAITDPAGGYVGMLDTTWNPASKELMVNSAAADAGPNSLGPSAVRQLRASLLDLYPGAQVLLGDRISGAGAGRQVAQTIRKSPTSP